MTDILHFTQLQTTIARIKSCNKTSVNDINDNRNNNNEDEDGDGARKMLMPLAFWYLAKRVCQSSIFPPCVFYFFWPHGMQFSRVC